MWVDENRKAPVADFLGWLLFISVFAQIIMLILEPASVSNAETGKLTFAVLIPAGFGHAFISLQNDTIQLYSVDRSGNDAHSKQINYKDSKIGLKLPIPISEISDYDLSAPFVSESGEEIGEEDPHFYKALDMRKFR